MTNDMKDSDIQKLITDSVYLATQSTKQENSGLIGDLKTTHAAMFLALGEIKNSIEGTNHRLDQLNSSVTKHELRLANQDVLNAQITITQSSQTEDLKGLKTNDKIYNDFKISFMSSLNTFKWLFGFVGFGTLIIFLKVVLGLF